MVSKRDRLRIPRAPAPRLVAGDQHYRLPLRVEHEKQPHLGVAGYPGPQLLEIMDLAAMGSVDQRPAKLRATGRQLVERLLNLVRRERAVLAQGEKPVVDPLQRQTSQRTSSL